MKTQVKAVKIGMVKIVALVLMMLGMNAQAEVYDISFKSQKDIIEQKALFVIPIKIIGVESFNAALFYDYSKTTMYSKPTIGLEIPIGENKVDRVFIEAYSLTKYQLNQMADRLGIKLDYCTKVDQYVKRPGEDLFITANYSLCGINDVINLEQVITTVQYRLSVN